MRYYCKQSVVNILKLAPCAHVQLSLGWVQRSGIIHEELTNSSKRTANSLSVS